MNPQEIKKQLEALGVRATKLRGQHFLIDKLVLEAIVAAAELKKDDTVLEVGPGLGVLTRELLASAGQVIAVELDLAFARRLKEIFVPQGLVLVHGDIREIEVRTLLGKNLKQYKLVANIPYNITSAILEKFLLGKPAPTIMVLLVQCEVAERVVAQPPYMNRLAILVQYFGKPEIVRQVPRGAFWPTPRVDSAVLRIRRYPEDVFRARERKVPRESFFRMVRTGFVAPRKKLLSNLRGMGYDQDTLLRAFQGTGIDRDVRPEAVSMDQWFILANLIMGNEKNP